MNFFRAIILTISLISAPLLAFQTPEEDVSKARLLLSNYRWIQMHYFLQTGVATNFNESAIENDFFINNNRLIFNGQTAKDVYFFVQTNDFDTQDKAAPGRSTMFTQDAYLSYYLMDEMKIYAGLMAIPISRKNLISDATTLAIEDRGYYVPLYGSTNNGRDTGIMLRGHLFARYLEYRFGMFQGLGREELSYTQSDGTTETHIRNEDAYPRFTTRFQVNIIDKEDGFFYSENYLRKREIFNIGLGFDFQPMVADKYKDGNFENYFAISGDLDVQAPLTASNALSVGLGLLYSSNNPTESDQSDSYSYSNIILFYLHAGVLIMEEHQPYLEFSIRDNSGGKVNSNKYSQMKLKAGYTYFLDSHHANARFQYDIPFSDSADEDFEHKLSLQMQIYL